MTERITRILLTVAFLAGACFVAENAYFLHLAKTEYTLLTTFLSVTVLHLRIRHALSEFGVLALSTVILMAVASRGDHFPSGIPLSLTLLGLASLTIVAIRTVWSIASDRSIFFWGFIASLSLVCLGWVIPPLLTWVAAANPKGFDLYLNSFDASLHVQPSFLVGRAFLKWSALRHFSIAFYMGITCLCTVVYADQLLRDVKKALSILIAFLWSGPIGILFYNLFPALGPAYLFGPNFPLRPLPANGIQHMRLEPVSLYGFPNAMPSLHMTWALLGLWYSRGASWWLRLIAQAFFVFTVLSTLGTGEHYLADLVVAFPFSLMIFAIFPLAATWVDAWRVRAIVFGVAGTILWMTLLRFQPSFFWSSPAIPWTLIALTIGVTAALRRRVLWAPDLAGSSSATSAIELDSTKPLGTDASAD
jgi:hypothetical protein